MEIAGIKLQDAGYIPEKSEPSGVLHTESKGKNEKIYPTIYLNDREVPAITDEELKDKCLFVAVVRIKSRREEIMKEKDKETTRITMDLEILQAGMKPMLNKNPEDMSVEEIDKELKKK